MFDLRSLTNAAGVFTVNLGGFDILLKYRRPDHFEMLDAQREEAPFERRRRAWREEFDVLVAAFRTENLECSEEDIQAKAYAEAPFEQSSEDYLPRLRFIDRMVVEVVGLSLDGQPVSVWSALTEDIRIRFLRSIPQVQLWALYGAIIESVSLGHAEKNV